MKKIVILLTFLLIFSSICWAKGNKENQPASQQRTQAASSSSPFWTGDGGRGRSIAILAPQATGLTANQNYIPALVQGEFVSNFTGFSAISVLDRVRLDEQYAELLSGYYSDDSEEGWDLGRLSPTDYIMGGNITRTATGFAMQISITRSSDKMTVASYSGTCTFDELNDLSGVRRASLDLLQKMGVTPTERARAELSGSAAANHINAQTALARGIVAQNLGNTAETLTQFYQAAAFDPTLSEAVARANTMSATVRTGSLGANIRNDIAWRDEWIKILADAQRSLQNLPVPQPPSLPQSIVVAQVISPDPVFQQGAINYTARTAEIFVNFDMYTSFRTVLYPEEYIAAYEEYRNAFRARNEVYNKIVYDINAGLNATERNSAWRLAPLEHIETTVPAITPRRGNVTITAVMELLNDEGRRIGSPRTETLGTVTFGERGTIFQNRANINRFSFIVRADDITDHMTTRFTINVSPVQNNIVQVITYAEYMEAEAIRREAEIAAAANRRAAEAEAAAIRREAEEKAYRELIETRGIVPLGTTTINDNQFSEKGLTEAIIPNSVTRINVRAFADNQLTNVIIPDSVTRIGESAFSGNRLTSVTIPNSVTQIGPSAFRRNHLTSVTIGNSVTRIGHSAFSLNQLSSVIIPHSVTYIGRGAFAFNPITSITIGANVEMDSLDVNNDNFTGYYYRNGRRAGTYTLNNGRWSFRAQ